MRAIRGVEPYLSLTHLIAGGSTRGVAGIPFPVFKEVAMPKHTPQERAKSSSKQQELKRLKAFQRGVSPGGNPVTFTPGVSFKSRKKIRQAVDERVKALESELSGTPKSAQQKVRERQQMLDTLARGGS